MLYTERSVSQRAVRGEDADTPQKQGPYAEEGVMALGKGRNRTDKKPAPAPGNDFDQLMIEVRRSMGAAYPSMAMLDVPRVLSRETKNKLLQLDAETVGRILVESIEKINNGFVGPMEELVNERLSGRDN